MTITIFSNEKSDLQQGMFIQYPSSIPVIYLENRKLIKCGTTIKKSDVPKNSPLLNSPAIINKLNDTFSYVGDASTMGMVSYYPTASYANSRYFQFDDETGDMWYMGASSGYFYMYYPKTRLFVRYRSPDNGQVYQCGYNVDNDLFCFGGQSGKLYNITRANLISGGAWGTTRVPSGTLSYNYSIPKYMYNDDILVGGRYQGYYGISRNLGVNWTTCLTNRNSNQSHLFFSQDGNIVSFNGNTSNLTYKYTSDNGASFETYPFPSISANGTSLGTPYDWRYKSDQNPNTGTVIFTTLNDNVYRKNSYFIFKNGQVDSEYSGEYRMFNDFVDHPSFLYDSTNNTPFKYTVNNSPITWIGDNTWICIVDYFSSLTESTYKNGTYRYYLSFDDGDTWELGGTFDISVYDHKPLGVALNRYNHNLVLYCNDDNAVYETGSSLDDEYLIPYIGPEENGLNYYLVL